MMQAATTQQDVVQTARDWLGVRWQHQGRSRSGVDCVGLVIRVAHECGRSRFDALDYKRVASDERMLLTADELLVRRPGVADLVAGDVVIMQFDQQRHMGILAPYIYGGLSLIHAYAPARKVVETRLASDMLERVMAGYGWPLAGVN